MKEKTIVYGLQDVAQTVEQVNQVVKNAAIVTLTGSLGAGKTTLVSAILKNFGVSDPVVSPTFNYVNVYKTIDGKKVYHFDLYRLDTLESFEQAGFAEYLYQENSICFIEWPNIIMPLLSSLVVHIQLDFIGLDKRKLVIKHNVDDRGIL